MPNALRFTRRALLMSAGLALLPRRPARAAARTPIIDTHVHLSRNLGRESLEDGVSHAVKAMDRYEIETVIVMPPPFPVSGWRGAYGLEDMRTALRGHARHFAYLAGGDLLNPMVQQTPADDISADTLRRFTETAERIAREGAAGFGEFAAEHFSSGHGRHPYESAPPDHPFFLALADIAAKHGMPIELHMEAVPHDMPFPPKLRKGPNPDRIHANIPRFERLLAHNRKARIVWAHAGWGHTGQRTTALMRALLGRHANLFMNIKINRHSNKRRAPFIPGKHTIRREWIAMLRAFPDRFMVGSDQFMGGDLEPMKNMRDFIDALPPALAPGIAAENAKAVYRLPST